MLSVLVEGGDSSSDLLQVGVAIASTEVCQVNQSDINGATQICAGFPEGGRDSCQGINLTHHR